MSFNVYNWRVNRTMDIPRWEADQRKARLVAGLFAVKAHDHFGHRVKRLKLFGSTVRGEWMPDSDVDILITLDQLSNDDRDWIVATAFSVGVLDHDVLIQPIILADSDYQHLIDRERQFALEVERTGVAL